MSIATMSQMEPNTAAPASAGEGPAVVGLKPWLPWPLSRWQWWTAPVAAERLAALRIGLALILLCDLLLTYWPGLGDYFTAQGLGGPDLFNYYSKWPRWSLLRGVTDISTLQLALTVWIIATVGLLLGCLTRLCAVVVWVLSASFANVNSYIDNAGDQVRTIMLLYLLLSPCGAAWSVDSWLWRRLGWRRGPVQVYPWVLRLLFVQMVVIYFCNGLYKAFGPDWHRGESLYYVLGDLTLARVSFTQLPVSYMLVRLLSWLVLAWEVGFPLWIVLPWTRKPALWLGVLFHLSIWISMEIGGFAPYMLCFYLPLVPWEKYLLGKSAKMSKE